MRVAVITASTPIYRGQEEDASGKVIRHILEEAGHDIVFQKALPCDKTVLSTVMQRMVDGELTDLILTGYSGGYACIYISDDKTCNAEQKRSRYQRKCTDCESSG